ncbi:MAG: hypothetical protein ACRENQ_11610 [Gemmatimonadaceae bacterium]
MLRREARSLNRTTDKDTPPRPALPPNRSRGLPATDDASTELDRLRMLAEVMDYVIKVSKPTPLVLPRPRVWVPAVTLLLFAFTIYSYAARPAWIWGPAVDSTQVLATHDADMRFAMFLLAQRIFEYRREFGAVPATLADVGDRIDSVQYVPLSDTSFSLRYESRRPIILYSTESMNAFLGNAVQVVTAGKPR